MIRAFIGIVGGIAALAYGTYLLFRKEEKQTVYESLDVANIPPDVEVVPGNMTQAEAVKGDTLKTPSTWERESLLRMFGGTGSYHVAKAAIWWAHQKEFPKIDPNFVFAIIKVESDFDSNAVAVEANVNDESVGFMQVRQDTAKWIMNWSSRPKGNYQGTVGWLLRDPYINVWVGMQYLEYQRKRYGGDLFDMAASYNAGSVKYRYGTTYINQGYVDKVMNYYTTYSERNEFADGRSL